MDLRARRRTERWQIANNTKITRVRTILDAKNIHIYYIRVYRIRAIINLEIIFKFSMTYNTKQREMLLTAIKYMRRSFSAQELHAQLNGEIGLTTVYRLVEKLAEEGVLIKTTRDNMSEYQYIEPCENEDHFYLKCNRCGEMKHVDCERVQGLTEHIAHEHGFELTNSHIVINGICAQCKKEKNEK